MEEQLFGKGEEKFKQLIKNSFDIIVLLDANGNQKYVSESCQKILGFEPEELMNIQVIEEMIHPGDQQKVLEGLGEILNNKANGGVQYRHRHKNGTWIYLEAFGTNQIDNPQVRSVVLNVRDITERKNAEKALMEREIQLTELNATKDRFFSIIAHDLRSPFNSIDGFCDILAKEIEKSNYDAARKYAKIIKKSSQQAMDLLTNLLTWSQSQTGRIEFKPDHFNLNRVVKEVVELLGDTAFQKSITIDYKLPEDIMIYADESMISSVLRNLISNGIKFSNSGGQVRVFAERNGNELIVSIEDHGVGINNKEVNKLFKIENSYSTPGTNQEKGTGLGLLLCKDFIEMHHGKIWVKSEEGKGSTFSFSLPDLSR